MVIREDLIIETTFVRRFTFDIGRDGVIQNISPKAFLRIFVLQVSRSCGRRWRRGTRACEANLRLKKSTQRRSSAHFPDTRTKILLRGLFEMLIENQWNLREQSQCEGLTQLQELRLAYLESTRIRRLTQLPSWQLCQELKLASWCQQKTFRQ